MHKEFKKFGFNIGLGLNILGFIMFYRHKEHFIWFSSTGSFVLISAIIYPDILAPIKNLLDRLIFALSWLISTISLIIVFYLIFTPIGLLLRLFGNDLLNQRISKTASSYWIKRRKEQFSKEFYERMG